MSRMILILVIICIAWLPANNQAQENPTPEQAQEDQKPEQMQDSYITEGYSALQLIPESLAQHVLNRLQKENPKATLQDAKLYFAKRKAAANARRNLAEYNNGVHFKFVRGKFIYEIKVCEGFVGGRGIYTHRLLDSGVVIAVKKLELPEDIQQIRLALESHDVIGYSSNNPADILQAIREARLNAIEKAARKAVKLKHPSAFQEKPKDQQEEKDEEDKDKDKTQALTYQGVVYIVTTVSDKAGTPYQITLRLQTEVQ